MAKGYWIVHVRVDDAEGYKRYVEANAAAFAKYEGRFLVRGGRFEMMAGEIAGDRHVVIEFKDFDTAVACYRSPEYQHALQVRGDAAKANVMVVEGYEPA
ncbi:DUF1330 domain-containing protein [Lutibaculum baratangense]|uniref:DUF1330 domain-containing protein n=1 Tax=Lutibaculum baratangense AMV1 TaxID=631454 RepID=V4RLA1_9HYPH|nr:DUF1330 domain-containing protein [Lutibaculum baratangense]ESR26084.1 hypothetical protein N177_1419 [Lutibaculum baratangense AMV1]